jgi:hypothetical protein
MKSHKVRFLILISAVVFGLMSVSLDSYAGATINGPPDEMMKVLSYNQLMRLNTDQRNEYMKDLRSLLVTLSQMSAKSKRGGLFAEQLSELNTQVVWLEMVLPRAEALGFGTFPRAKKAGTPDTATSKNTDAGAPATKADRGSKKVNLVNLPCEGNGLSASKIDGQRVCQEGKSDQSDKCSEGTIPVKQTKEGKFTCITRESFNQIADEKIRKAFCTSRADATSAQAIEFAKNCPADGAKIASPAEPAAKASVQASASGCEQPEPSTCADFEQAKTDYHKESNHSTCIYAGNFSSYPANRATFGNCDRPRKAFGLKCDDQPGTVICNPLIFGVHKDGSAICIPTSATATQKCNDEVDDLQKPTSALGYQEDYLAQGPFKDHWDEFANKFNSSCFPSDSPIARFHCSECIVMRKRLLKMQLNVAGNPSECAKAATNVDWDKVKARVAKAVGEPVNAASTKGQPPGSKQAPALPGGPAPSIQ